MKSFLLNLLFLSINLALFAQYEPIAKGERAKHTFYQLDYNEEHEQPNWVHYVLTKENLSGETQRTNKFKADPKVSTGSAQLTDYRGSGYDRGHLCPAADMKQSKIAMQETFYMSNMSPQHPSFNRGIWKMCEAHFRSLLNDTLYIVTGPILKKDLNSIGSNKVTIPEAYYKIAYDKKIGRMYAYVIPNKKNYEPLATFKTSVDQIEELTGIDFFYQLPDKLEHELEKASNV